MSHECAADPFDAIVPSLPSPCRAWGRGWCAAAAGILEASAAKPGNVHPAAAFADLEHGELVAAALAIAPAMERAADVRLGKTILAAVTASRAVTRSNANLGIVLAIAPLAAVPDARCATPRGLQPRPADVADVLARLTPADAADVWRAIGVARPGGMGTSPSHDLAGPPPEDLLEAMRLAAPRDAIARLWSEGYEPLHAGLVADLEAAIGAGRPLAAAIVAAFLLQLAREPDSLVARKHGPDVAADVSRRAAAAAADPARIADFDRQLRGAGINPGTTADLTAAALYILLADGRLRPPAAAPLPRSG
jgi:triphosphoribosyl-dephospho-CoA synthase